MSYCTACAVHVSDGWKFCAGCGATTDAPATSDAHHCTDCGLDGHSSWTFCPRCASSRELVGDRTAHCVACGQAHDPTWAHCATCGIAAGDHPLDGHHCTQCGAGTAKVWEHCGSCGLPTALAGRPDGQFCNRCGIRTSNTWSCCAGCGEALLTPADARVASGAHCIACGVRGDNAWQHCPACGDERPGEVAVAEATGHFCVECGSRCDDLWSHCAMCGHEVTPDEVDPGITTAEAGMDSAGAVLAAQASVIDATEQTLAADQPDATPVEVKAVEASPPASAEATSVIDEPVVALAEVLEAPAETEAADHQRRQRVEFAPRGDMLGAATQVLSLAAAFLGAMCVLGLFRLNRELDNLGRNLANGAEANVTSVDDAEQVLERVFQPMFLIAAVLSLIVLAAWTRRRHAHALGYGVVEPSLSSTWVGASFFVPVVNVVVPKRGVEETWRASSPGAAADTRWAERPTSLWIPTWRLLAVIGVGLIVLGATLDATSIEKSIDANTWSAIGYAVITLSFLSAIVVVSSINNLQMQRDYERETGELDAEFPDLLATIGGVSE